MSDIKKPNTSDTLLIGCERRVQLVQFRGDKVPKIYHKCRLIHNMITEWEHVQG